MIERKIKTTDGPNGEVTVSNERGFLDTRLAINLGGEGEYLAIHVHLTAKEARLIAEALLDSAGGAPKNEDTSTRAQPEIVHLSEF